jgi:hypothetical protein
MYLIVRGQLRIAGMGDLVDLDHGAVLEDIGLFVPSGQVKEFFAGVVECFNIERELAE